MSKPYGQELDRMLEAGGAYDESEPTGPTGGSKNCGQSHPVHGERCYRPLGHTGMHHAMDDDGAVWKWNEHMELSGPTGEKRGGARMWAFQDFDGNVDMKDLLTHKSPIRDHGYIVPVTVFREDSGKVLVDRETLRVAEVLLQAVGDEFARMDEHNEASGWTWTVDGCTVSPHHIADEANSVAELLRAALTSSPGEAPDQARDDAELDDMEHARTVNRSPGEESEAG